MGNAGTTLILCVVVSGCSSAGGTTPSTRADSAGVEIVSSSGADRMLGWKLDEEITIDSENQKGAGPFDPREAAVRTDAAGRIHVLDYSGNRVLVFGPDGAFQRALGRKGAGPGEMSFSLSFTVAPAGTVGVFDIGKHRLVRFSPDGAILDEQEIGRGFTGGRIRTVADGYVHDFQGGGAGARQSGIFHSTNGGGSAYVTSPDPPMKPITLESCGMSFSGMPPLLAPSYRWDASGDLVVFTREAAYDIHVWQNGREVRRIRRDITPRATTPELAAQEVGDGMQVRTEGGVRNCAADEVVKQRGYAPHIPTIGKIVIAPNGELWVRRGGVKDESLPIDIFAEDGSYVGTLLAETPFPAAFMPDGRVVAVTQDENDVGVIRVYRVRR